MEGTCVFSIYRVHSIFLHVICRRDAGDCLNVEILVCFQERYEELQRQNNVKRRIVVRMQRRDATIAFNSFCDAVQESVRKRNLMVRVTTTWTKSALVACFECWIGIIEDSVIERQVKVLSIFCSVCFIHN